MKYDFTSDEKDDLVEVLEKKYLQTLCSPDFFDTMLPDYIKVYSKTLRKKLKLNLLKLNFSKKEVGALRQMLPPQHEMQCFLEN